MRLRKEQLVISFASTHAAMSFSSYARREAIPGKLIALPQEIQASCGFAWNLECSSQEFSNELKEKLLSVGISEDHIHRVELLVST